MNEINSKIYYLISTGEILCITSEYKGLTESNTKEQDMKIYRQLKNYSIDEIDFIELEYGTLAETFNNAKSYKINLETKQLEVVYYTKEELILIQQQNQKQINLNDRINLIAKYSNLDTSSIADLEKYILQREKDRIVGGVK
jgi:uncharacterized protein YkuJ